MRGWYVPRLVSHSSSTSAISPRSEASSSGASVMLTMAIPYGSLYRGKTGDFKSGNGLSYDVVISLKVIWIRVIAFMLTISTPVQLLDLISLIDHWNIRSNKSRCVR